MSPSMTGMFFDLSPMGIVGVELNMAPNAAIDPLVPCSHDPAQTSITSVAEALSKSPWVFKAALLASTRMELPIDCLIAAITVNRSPQRCASDVDVLSKKPGGAAISQDHRTKLSPKATLRSGQ